MPEKHKELSEQLTSWWHTQTEFETKKALAALLKVHPDTLGDYFSGRKFPKSDIANRLCEVTNIECLRPDAGGSSSPGKVPRGFPNNDAPREEPQESVAAGSSSRLQEQPRLRKGPEVAAGQPPRGRSLKGMRHGERSVVISFQRTRCPFCAHDIARFRSCVYCGQNFVWANVPLENNEPM